MALGPAGRLDYAPWSVDIFESDAKINKLIKTQGWTGFGIYFYLCQRAYGTNGYYLDWSCDDADMAADKMPGVVGSRTVQNTVNLCFVLGLFDKASYERHRILTSRGIQKRYAMVAAKNPKRLINPDYWLLAENGEDVRRVSCAQNSNISPENAVFRPQNPVSAGAEPQRERERERKVIDTEKEKERAHPAGGRQPEATGGSDWLRAMSDAGMQPTAKARKIVGAVAARYGGAEACICIAIAAAQGKPGAEYVRGIARTRAEEGRSGEPLKPPAAKRPRKEVAAHRYEQRAYTDEELNALFYDPKKEEGRCRGLDAGHAGEP